MWCSHGLKRRRPLPLPSPNPNGVSMLRSLSLEEPIPLQFVNSFRRRLEMSRLAFLEPTQFSIYILRNLQ